MHIQPYLFFDGRCEEALEFYGRALGGKVTALMRWKEMPGENQVPKERANRVMHAELRVGDAVVLAADRPTEQRANFEGISLTVSAADDAEAERVFNNL